MENKILFILFFLLYNVLLIHSQEELATPEFWVDNASDVPGRTIEVKVYPVSMIFKGQDENGISKYDLNSFYDGPENYWKFNGGTNVEDHGDPYM
jgi:hypothetical protein